MVCVERFFSLAEVVLISFSKGFAELKSTGVSRILTGPIGCGSMKNSRAVMTAIQVCFQIL